MGEENNQIVLIFALSTIFVVFFATLFILFLVVYKKRIVVQEHRLQKLENERQKALLKATIEGQERERKRFAKDLHDGMGSLLSGLSLNLKFLKGQETRGSEQFVFLDEACKLMDESIDNVRSISHNLMPATLENLGLIPAIKECIQSLDRTKNVTVSVNTINEPFEISNTTALGILRVFQELVQNTIKHANASEVSVLITYNTHSISLDYMDNGCGFDLNQIDSNGIGIKNMQSRIMALSGSIDIGNSKNGFEAKIKIPLILKDHNE